MEKIISVINKKGGCGKTTTLMALADGLAIEGKKVLVVDLDSQMNLSMGYGNFHISKISIYDVLMNKEMDIHNAIYPVPDSYFDGIKIKGKVDIIPANSYVNRLQEELNKMMRKEERLLRCLQKLDANEYDYILIDTAPLPVTDIIITNVMVASDEIIVPTKLEPFSSTGIELILPRIDQIISEDLNPTLKINGIVCTQVVGRRKLSNTEVYSGIASYSMKKGIYLYDSYIRSLEGVVSSQNAKKTIFAPRKYIRSTKKKNGEIVTKEFSSQTDIGKDYKEFVKEFIRKENL